MYNIEQIDCTLKYGKVYIKQLKLLNILNLILVVISNLLLIGGIVLWAVSEIAIKEFSLVAIIYIAITLLVVTSVYILKKNKKRNIEITEWLKDAVELKAEINRLDLTNANYQPYQIEVVLKYKGKEIRKISNKANHLTEGAHKIFAKYHNKKVNVLYSEKYDEILLIKKADKE